MMRRGRAKTYRGEKAPMVTEEGDYGIGGRVEVKEKEKNKKKGKVRICTTREEPSYIKSHINCKGGCLGWTCDILVLCIFQQAQSLYEELYGQRS